MARSQRHLREAHGKASNGDTTASQFNSGRSVKYGSGAARVKLDEVDLTYPVARVSATVAFNLVLNRAKTGSSFGVSAPGCTTPAVSGSGVTRSFTGTYATPGEKTITFTETLGGADGSPKATIVKLIVY